MEHAAVQTESQRHPIRLRVEDDLRRSRLTVFFRLVLAIPHFIWLYIWGILAGLAAILNWFATLFAGRSPEGLHRFLAAFLRYQTHVLAYSTLLADPYPGFTGREGSYAFDAIVDPPAPQRRLITFFRLILGIPAFILSYVLHGVWTVVAIFAWFVCLALGRMPEGMENLGTYCLRYHAQTQGYVYLLTERYPSLSFPRVAE